MRRLLEKHRSIALIKIHLECLFDTSDTNKRLVALRGVFSRHCWWIIKHRAFFSVSLLKYWLISLHMMCHLPSVFLNEPFLISTQTLCAYIGSRWQVSNLRWRQKKCARWEGYIGHWSRYWALSEYHAAHTRFQILLCVNVGLFVFSHLRHSRPYSCYFSLLWLNESCWSGTSTWERACGKKKLNGKLWCGTTAPTGLIIPESNCAPPSSFKTGNLAVTRNRKKHGVEMNSSQEGGVKDYKLIACWSSC